MQRASRTLGTTDIGEIVRRYRSRSFGFASRNFYAEFLAAVDVEKNHEAHFGQLTRNAPLQFETVQIDHYVAYETLRRCAGTDDATFRQLNPGFRPEVLDGRLHVPPQTTLRVPPGKAGEFKAAYAALSSEERFDQQRFYYVRYRVQRGDTLGGIAASYDTTVEQLLTLNPDLDPNALQPGTRIRVG